MPSSRLDLLGLAYDFPERRFNFEEGKLPKPNGETIVRTPMGAADAYVGTLEDRMEFGPFRLDNVEVKFADLPQLKQHGAGNIGMGVLDRYRVTLDQQNGRLRLQEPKK